MHPLDMDLRDTIKYDAGLIKRLKNSNLSLDDLTIAGKTLNNRKISVNTGSAVFEAEACDPNILGFIGDLALQVNSIDVCVVFCRVNGGLKLSIRSCVREVMASELAERLCQGIGSGGGHSDKAGGFISIDKLDDRLRDNPSEFLFNRLIQYFNGYDLVYCGRLNIDIQTLEPYRKNKIPIGFVRTVDVFPSGKELVIRTLEGDTYVSSDPDIYVMVGIYQEVWPIKRLKFEASYRELDSVYVHDERFRKEKQYEPTVKDRIQGEAISLLPFIHPCVPTGEITIYVKKLEKRTKVFTAWNLESYMFGDIGDYLAVRGDDPNDAYIIEESIFHETYTKIP